MYGFALCAVRRPRRSALSTARLPQARAGMGQLHGAHLPAQVGAWGLGVWHGCVGATSGCRERDAGVVAEQQAASTQYKYGSLTAGTRTRHGVVIPFPQLRATKRTDGWTIQLGGPPATECPVHTGGGDPRGRHRARRSGATEPACLQLDSWKWVVCTPFWGRVHLLRLRPVPAGHIHIPAAVGTTNALAFACVRHPCKTTWRPLMRNDLT